MQDFRKLLVREKAHRLTLRVYEATDRFPREELFGPVLSVLRADTVEQAIDLITTTNDYGNASSIA